MPLLVAGIDEAGYGPLLGPLCVALSAWLVHDPDDAVPPDLWARLHPGVARTPADRRRRIAIADSKLLFHRASRARRDPLYHLERGVLALLEASGRPCRSDRALLTCLGARLAARPWYRGAPDRLPIALSADELSIAANRLRRAMHAADCRLLDVRCTAVSEAAINRAVRRCGTKSAATLQAIGQHLRRLHQLACTSDATVHVMIDRVGARVRYGRLLRRWLADCAILHADERSDASVYHAQIAGRPFLVTFATRAERVSLPVAAASMTAKLVRELAMRRFNAYWCQRIAELKPTAGYRQDGARWLAQVERYLSPPERAALVRLA